MTQQTAEQQVAARFATDTAQHQLTVKHDDGLYRHIRVMAPKSSGYWFDLITWPSNLTIVGDCGSFVFSRVEDMFEFFRGKRINPDYWAEKERSGASKREYSEDKFRQLVAENTAEAIRWSDAPRGIGKAVRERILGSGELYYEAGARDALDEFEFKGFRFTDTWEWSFSDWDWQYLWCCHAVQFGIRLYDKARQSAEVAALAQGA